MAFEPNVVGQGPRSAGDLVLVIDAASARYGKIGRVAYFVGDNVYVAFGNRRWSPKRMFFPDQLRAVPPVRTAQQTVRISRLLHGASRILTLLHLQ